MRLHRFRKRLGPRRALTTDHSGRNLPADGSPWLYEATLELDAASCGPDGPTKPEIAAALDAHGYFIWNVAIDETD